jgi:hypothetical protein
MQNRREGRVTSSRPTVDLYINGNIDEQIKNIVSFVDILCYTQSSYRDKQTDTRRWKTVPNSLHQHKYTGQSALLFSSQRRPTKWILGRQDGVVWISLIWLRTGTSDTLLWTRQWTFGFHKTLGNSRVAGRLAASQELLNSMELLRDEQQVTDYSLLVCDHVQFRRW